MFQVLLGTGDVVVNKTKIPALKEFTLCGDTDNK